MCKEILRNEKGLSLVEVVVASAISIIIAMGVMTINDNAQRGMSKVQGDAALNTFKLLMDQELNNPENCTGTLGAGLDVARDNTTLTQLNTPGVANTPVSPGRAPKLLAQEGERIPIAQDFEVLSITVERFDNNGFVNQTANTADRLIGRCDIIMSIVNRKLFKDDDTKARFVRFPITCEVNTVDVTLPPAPAGTVSALQSCMSAASLANEGHFKQQDDGSIRSDTNRVQISDGSWISAIPSPNDIISAGITIGQDVPAWPQAPGVQTHGMALPDDTAITFGSLNQVGLYYDPVTANTLDTNQNFHAAGRVSAVTISGEDIHATNFHGSVLNVTSANIGSGLLAGGVNITSDERYKKEIEEITRASESIDELRGVTYFMRVDEFPEKKFNEDLQHGLIAQEVEKILPNLVNTDDSTGYKSVNYIGIIPILIEAFKEQQAEIAKNKEMFHVMKEGLEVREAKQNARIEALERENKQLRKELDELKEQVRKIILRE